MIEETDVTVETILVAAAVESRTAIDRVMKEDPEDLFHLTIFLQQLQRGILAYQLINSLGVQRLEVLSGIVHTENLGLGIFVQCGVVNRTEHEEIHSIPESDKGIFLQNDLPLLDLPGSEDPPPQARSLPDDVGRADWLVGFPMGFLAFLGTVEHLPTHAALQLLLGILLAEITRTHL